MQKKRGLFAVMAAISLSITLAGLSPATSVSQIPSATKTQQQVAAAKKMLKSIKTLTTYSSKDYDREAQFGDAWLDVNGNGCDTRNDMLKRDLIKETFNDDCEIATGVLKDRYTLKTINFKRGVGTSLAVQIDHVIPLAFAWRSGAHSWGLGKRVAFANDPINLMAVDGPTNSSKSDSGPDEWLPPNSAYHCTYVIRFTRIAQQYGLRLTAATKRAITSELNTCRSVVGSPATLIPLSPATWPRAAALAS